jgi:hypothetical protein
LPGEKGPFGKEIRMKSRAALVFGIALLFATTLFAQDYHKLDVTVDYSYVHANPQNNNIIPTFSLNGGGGSAAFYFSKLIGIEAEFEGYGSYTHNFTIPAGNAACPGTVACAVSAQGNLFTYNVGPIVKFRLSHFEPFVETLFGGAHSNLLRKSLQELRCCWLCRRHQVTEQQCV